MARYTAVSSPTLVLQVLGYPTIAIENVSQSHTSAPTGTVISCIVDVLEVGGEAGNYKITIRDNVGILVDSSWRYLAGMSGETITLTFNMPSRDLNGLKAEAYNEVGLTFTYPMTTITWLIATALTLILSKTQVKPNEAVTASGKLTRTDTGTGLANQIVKVIYNSTLAGSSVTASDGSYIVNFNAPATPKSYSVYASFEGSTAAGLSPSTSEHVTLTASRITYVVYDSDQSDLEAAQIISRAKNFPLLQTPETKDPSIYDSVYDENNLICIGLWPANAYTGYYFPEIYPATDWTNKVIDRTKVKGVSEDGKYVINTIQRPNGTTVTVVGGIDASDTLRAATDYVSQIKRIPLWPIILTTGAILTLLSIKK